MARTTAQAELSRGKLSLELNAGKAFAELLPEAEADPAETIMELTTDGVMAVSRSFQGRYWAGHRVPTKNPRKRAKKPVIMATRLIKLISLRQNEKHMRSPLSPLEYLSDGEE